MTPGRNSSWKSMGWSSSSAISMNIGNLRAHLLIPRRPAEHAQRRKFSREQHLRIMGGAGGVNAVTGHADRGASGSFQPECFKGSLIRHRFSALLGHYAEAAAVIPRRPADAMVFQRRADIVQPGGTVVGVGILAIDAKLVADDGNCFLFRPFRNLRDLGINAVGVPMVASIACDVEPIQGIWFESSDLLRGPRVGRVRQAFDEVPMIHTPSGALVRENVWLVEVKVVDHVGIPERLQEK